MPVSPVGPRNVGESFLYRGIMRAPQACVVIERYDDVEKETRDGTVMFGDETMTWFFDFQLHSLDCTGPVENPIRKNILSREPCPCGAWPGDPQHKLRRLMHIKNKLQADGEVEAGNNVFHFGEDGTVTPIETPEQLDKIRKQKTRSIA